MSEHKTKHGWKRIWIPEDLTGFLCSAKWHLYLSDFSKHHYYICVFLYPCWFLFGWVWVFFLLSLLFFFLMMPVNNLHLQWSQLGLSHSLLLLRYVFGEMLPFILEDCLSIFPAVKKLLIDFIITECLWLLWFSWLLDFVMLGQCHLCSFVLGLGE